MDSTMDGIIPIAPPSPALTDATPPPHSGKRQKTAASQAASQPQSDSAAQTEAVRAPLELRREESYVHKPCSATRSRSVEEKTKTNQTMASNLKQGQAKPPRGRKRFMADLREAIECCESGEGYVAQSFRVQGGLSRLIERAAS